MSHWFLNAFLEGVVRDDCENVGPGLAIIKSEWREMPVKSIVVCVRYCTSNRLGRSVAQTCSSLFGWVIGGSCD